MARWLRAAGHEAWWTAGIDDGDLLRQAQHLGAVVLTTDSGLLERRLVCRGAVPVFWLPPTLRIQQQLALVFREFCLEIRPPRCTACSGELDSGDKEALRQLIPPKTYRWLDEYFVCRRCGKLFWRGTHWRSITRQLHELREGQT